jgi:hypothetical protein
MMPRGIGVSFKFSILYGIKKECPYEDLLQVHLQMLPISSIIMAFVLVYARRTDAEP